MIGAALVLLVAGAWRVAVASGAAPGPERTAAALALAVAELAAATRLGALLFDASAGTVTAAVALVGAGSWWWAGAAARPPGAPRFAIGAETGRALLVVAGGVAAAVVCGRADGALVGAVRSAAHGVAAGRPALAGPDAIGAFAAGRWALVGAVGAGRLVAFAVIGGAAAAASLALVRDWRWATLIAVVLVIDLDQGGLLAAAATVAVAAGCASVWLGRLRTVRRRPVPTRARPRREPSPVPPARPQRAAVRRPPRAALWGTAWVGAVALGASPAAPVVAVLVVLASRGQRGGRPATGGSTDQGKLIQASVCFQA